MCHECLLGVCGEVMQAMGGVVCVVGENVLVGVCGCVVQVICGVVCVMWAYMS